MCYVMLYSKTFYEEKRVFTFVWNSRYGTFFVFLSNVYETTMISSPRQHFTGTWPLKPAHQELSPPRTPLLPALQRRIEKPKRARGLARLAGHANTQNLLVSFEILCWRRATTER